MADIGGYPIHDYGTGPVLKSFMHSLDWDEKQKAVEKAAQLEVLKNTRELGESLSTTGDLTQGGIDTYLKSGGQPGMVPSLLQRNERMKQAKEAEYQGKIIENAKNSAQVGESIGKSISEIFKVGREVGESQQKQINNLESLSARGIIPQSEVVNFKENAFNSIMPILQKANLAETYGPLIKDGIQTGRVKESYETMVQLEIAKNSSIINSQDPKVTVEDRASAFGKNKQLIISSGMKPEEMKMLIGKDNELFEAVMKDKLAPPKLTPTNEDKAISDFLGAQGKANTEANRDWAREQLKLRSLKPEADKVHEIKINQLVEQYPSLSRQDATGIILGTIKIKEDPVSGTMYITDLVKGTQRPLIEVGVTPQGEPSAKPVNKTIWELSGQSTGIVSAAKAVGSIATGTVGLPVAKDTLYARQYVEGAQNDLIRSLSINPRFPVGEMERIKKEVNLSPTVFDNPPMMRQRILAINDYLNKRVENEDVAAKDPSLGVEARKNARTAAKDIRNFLTILGAPKIVKSEEDYNALPAGASYLTGDGITRRKGTKK